MIDNTRAKTGYDIEFLLGNRYFLTIIKAALASGNSLTVNIPTVWGSLEFEILDIMQCRINDEDQGNILESNRIRDLSLDFNIRLTFNKKQSDGSNLKVVHETSMTMEVDLRVNAGQIGLVSWKMPTESKKRINDISMNEVDSLLDLMIMFFFNSLPSSSMTGNIGPQNIRHIALRKLNSTPECQTAIGLYLNLDLDLNGYYENELARYLKKRFYYYDLTKWKTGAEVLEYIEKYNHPKDIHGEPTQQPFPLNPQMELDVAYHGIRWHLDHLNIFREYRCEDCIGNILIPDKTNGFVVQNWQHSTLDPAEVLASGGNSIYAHILGNRHFGSLEIDQATNHPVVKDVTGRVLTLEEIYELYLKNPLRGNLVAAENYLPIYADYIVGINPNVLGRFEKNTWNQMKADNPKKNPPLYDEYGFKAGKYNRLTLKWGEQSITVESNLTYFINNYPDAEVDVTAVMTPSITPEMLLAWDSKITDLDADTGILTDILGGLAFGLLGSLGFFGGALLGVGLAIGGAVAGAGIAEAVESCIASSTKERAQQALQSQSGDLFNLLPAINGMFPKFLRDEACYLEMHGVSHCFKEFKINKSGMALGGWAAKGMYYVPLDVEIIGRVRITLPDVDSEILISIRYRNIYGIEGNVQISELVARLENGRLKKTRLIPEAVHRGPRRIDHIRFTTGVELRPTEVMDLMDMGVISVRGYTVIHMKSGTRYLRNVPDKSKDNNLSEMRTFKP